MLLSSIFVGREWLVSSLQSFQQFIVSLKTLVKERGEIPYTEKVTGIGDNSNLGTFIFYKLLLLYQLIMSYHEEVNNDDTSYAISMYRERIRFLLSDKGKGVDVNHQSGK